MNSSLDSLVKNLSDYDFKYLSAEFSGGFLKLVKEKGVYLYEYMNSFKKFSKNKLPDKCKFFSSLKDVSICEKDYLEADNSWNEYKINSDVLLFADVFHLSVLFQFAELYL